MAQSERRQRPIHHGANNATISVDAIKSRCSTCACFSNEPADEVGYEASDDKDEGEDVEASLLKKEIEVWFGWKKGIDYDASSARAAGPGVSERRKDGHCREGRRRHFCSVQGCK